MSIQNQLHSLGYKYRPSGSMFDKYIKDGDFPPLEIYYGTSPNLSKHMFILIYYKGSGWPPKTVYFKNMADYSKIIIEIYEGIQIITDSDKYYINTD